MPVVDIDKGWAKMLGNLRKLAEQEVKAGIQSDEMTKDGEVSLARVAAVHEFGMVIQQGYRINTVRRRIKKNGSFAKGGRFVKRKYSNFETQHIAKPHVIVIPQRSFIRSTYDENLEVIHSTAAHVALDVAYKELDPGKGMEIIGNKVEGLIKKKIRTGPFKPNAPSTIRRKGSSRPLIDTGHLRQSVRYKIVRRST